MLILASASPRRKELLRKLVPEFKIIPSRIDERVMDDLDPSIMPLEESRLKAYDLFSRYPGNEVLAADTVVILDGKIYGKPKDYDDAVRMLKAEQGRSQMVLTGYCYLSSDREINRTVSTKVRFRKMGEAEIREYLDRCRPFDKAGAYGIQDEGTPVESIEGSFDNVMGLPTEDLALHVFRK